MKKFKKEKPQQQLEMPEYDGEIVQVEKRNKSL